MFKCAVILEEIFNSFSFLRNVFSNEFLLCPGAAVQVGSMFLSSFPLVYIHEAEDVLLQDVIFVVCLFSTFIINFKQPEVVCVV